MNPSNMKNNKEKIVLAHGSGGKLSSRLIKDILKSFTSPVLRKLDDSAVLDINYKGKKLAFTTDSYVINPVFFPGGDIGKLAVCGTVNDLSMTGAKPLWLSASAIIEEGFPMDDFRKIIVSMNKTAKAAGVEIVTGDTKVVEKGNADGIFINTSGIGVIEKSLDIGSANAKIGDRIIISGTVADHGMAIMSARKEFNLKTVIKSDCSALNGLTRAMLKASKNIHVMRDPTRGGLATSLNEIAEKSGVGIEISEKDIPVRNQTRGLCEMLGFDPLYVANEGKLVAFVAKKDAEKILNAMKKTVDGRNAGIIGEVVKEHRKKVLLKTRIGGMRMVDTLTGEQLPRIC